MYKLIIIVLILCSSLDAFAQQQKYNENVDKKTYDLFVKSDWENLREVSESAISSGIDFYFLRMRLGVSYYNEENFISSIPHFEKAVLFSPKDSIALEYLYYAYLFSGQEAEAKILGEKFASPLKTKIKFEKDNFFKGFYSEGGYTLNSDYKGKKNNVLKGNNNISGTQNIFKDGAYYNVSLMHSIGSRISVFHGYSNVTVNSTRQFEDNVNGKKEFSTSVKQNEYYINLGFYLGKGFNLTTAFHYLNVKVEDFIPPSLFNPAFSSTTINSDNNVLNLAVSKRIGKTEIGLTSVFGNMNNAKQNQNSFTFIWYPLGNLNLYNVINLTIHTNKNSDTSDAVSRFIFDEKIGFKVFNKLWAEVVFTSGPIFNYSESNAFIIYNNTDKIKYKAGFNLVSPVSEKIELSLRYLFLSQEYESTTTDLNNITSVKTNNLLNHKIIGGIKWTF